jgi:hypothetical protein
MQKKKNQRIHKNSRFISPIHKPPLIRFYPEPTQSPVLYTFNFSEILTIQAMQALRNIEACSWKTLLQCKSNEYYLFWVRVCTLGYTACNAHAPYYMVICGLFGSVIFFPRHLWNGTIWIRNMFWISLQIFSQTLVTSRKVQWDVITNVLSLHVKYPLLLWGCNGTLICFSADIRKNLKYQISWKSVQWEPSFPIRTDMTKLLVAFRNFTNAPKNIAILVPPMT